MDQSTTPDTRTRFLRRLKWGAIILPALFAWWSETVRHQLFDNAPVLLGNLVTAVLAFVGAYVVAQIIFHQVDRIDAALIAQNHRLATLHALAVTASQPGDEATLLATSLPIVRDALRVREVDFLINPPVPPSMASGTVQQTLLYDGVPLGMLMLRGIPTGFDQALFASISDALTMSIANRRLSAQAARLAVLEERDRIARELHDGLAQTLAAITWQSERARASLADGNAGAVRVAVDRIEEASGTAYADVREAIVGLRIGDASDFISALHQTVERFSDVTGIPVAVQATMPAPRIGAMTELQLLRIVQECLTNVRKHAGATTVTVQMATDATDALLLSVTDNGVGFDADHLPRGDRQHFGLIIMRERIESLGGRLHVETALGKGTTVRVTVAEHAVNMRGVA